VGSRKGRSMMLILSTSRCISALLIDSPDDHSGSGALMPLITNSKGCRGHRHKCRACVSASASLGRALAAALVRVKRCVTSFSSCVRSVRIP